MDKTLWYKHNIDLHIDLAHLSEPILDIGCGENGTLVNYLRKKNWTLTALTDFPLILILHKVSTG